MQSVENSGKKREITVRDVVKLLMKGRLFRNWVHGVANFLEVPEELVLRCQPAKNLLTSLVEKSAYEKTPSKIEQEVIEEIEKYWKEMYRYWTRKGMSKLRLEKR